MANFAVNVAEMQLIDQLSDGQGTQSLLVRFFDIANIIFTAMFTFELLVNLYGHWLQPFLTNPWSILDFMVVLMSLVALTQVFIPITVVRLMRAFRVIRLFGRLKALRKMIMALTASILPMMNAFLILFIITSIYAIMGVSVFGQQSDDFGRFDQAFVAMFRLTTENTWPETVPSHNEDGTVNWKCAIFMMSYIVLQNWIILQVSVAVLLDSFVSATTQIDELEKRQAREEARRKNQAQSPLEPLLKKLCREVVDDADLSDKLRNLFEFLDFDQSGGLTCSKFCAGIKKLEFSPRIHLAVSDFLSLTRGGGLCDEAGKISTDAFEFAMREQLRLYAQGQLCNPHQRSRMEAELALVSALKWVLLDNQILRRDVEALRDYLCPASSPPTSDDAPHTLAKSKESPAHEAAAAAGPPPDPRPRLPLEDRLAAAVCEALRALPQNRHALLAGAASAAAHSTSGSDWGGVPAGEANLGLQTRWLGAGRRRLVLARTRSEWAVRQRAGSQLLPVGSVDGVRRLHGSGSEEVAGAMATREQQMPLPMPLARSVSCIEAASAPPAPPRSTLLGAAGDAGGGGGITSLEAWERMLSREGGPAATVSAQLVYAPADGSRDDAAGLLSAAPSADRPVTLVCARPGESGGQAAVDPSRRRSDVQQRIASGSPPATAEAGGGGWRGGNDTTRGRRQSLTSGAAGGGGGGEGGQPAWLRQLLAEAGWQGSPGLEKDTALTAIMRARRHPPTPPPSPPAAAAAAAAAAAPQLLPPSGAGGRRHVPP